MATLGTRLAKARKAAGYSQEQVAQVLSIKRQTYSAYERDVSIPDAITLGKLADLFQLSADSLLGKQPPFAPPDKTNITDLPLAPGAKVDDQPTFSKDNLEVFAAHSAEPVSEETRREVLLEIENILKKHHIIHDEKDLE
ncbi:MAG: helix-turn-helix transcriptional regulator [Clostridiales bacterium]|nr:helix-turn-helix transcriptional regulator [Clostridiales bacterium]